jgi:hypothetical protein
MKNNIFFGQIRYLQMKRYIVEFVKLFLLSLLQRRRGTVATVDEEIEFRAVQRASTSSVTRDFALQNISLRERDCHLPHGGRLKNALFRPHKLTDKSKIES